jgi:tRNA (cytidine/uridine-2'-O-)-methyltransferase
VQQPSVNPLLDLQQAVNFRIIDEFQRLGVQFAYPTQRRHAGRSARPERPRSAVIHVVLFEPEIPPNTGNVIRLCANTGATLHLVKPLGFRVDDKSLQRSGLDYHDLASVKVHENLEACVIELGGARLFAVETGGQPALQRRSLSRRRCVSVRPGNPRPAGEVLDRVGRDASVFIPMRAHSRSINLSNAVALVAYEAWRQLGFAGS